MKTKRRENAYFSVEAALILPLVTAALLLGIYLLCFQYDRCLLEQDMGRLLLSGQSASMEAQGDAELWESQMRKKAETISWDKYVAWEMEKLDMVLQKNQIRVTGQGKLNFPVPRWNIWKKDDSFRAKADYTVKRLSPVYEIRQYRKLQKGWSAAGSAETE